MRRLVFVSRERGFREVFILDIGLKTGLEYVDCLIERTYGTLNFSNSHELMRRLKTLHLMEIGKLVMLTAHRSEETRGKHLRIDHPSTDLLYDNKFITVQKVDGKPRVGRRDRA